MLYQPCKSACFATLSSLYKSLICLEKEKGMLAFFPCAAFSDTST